MITMAIWLEVAFENASSLFSSCAASSGERKLLDRERLFTSLSGVGFMEFLACQHKQAYKT